MIDPAALRERPEAVKANLENRNLHFLIPNIEVWMSLDKERTALRQELDEINRKQNELAGQFKGNIPTEEQRNLGKELKETGRDLQTRFESVDKEWHDLLIQFPVMASDSTPVGRSEADNVVVREVGEKPNFGFQPKDHYELAKNLGLLDFEAGAKVSGSQFYFTKGDLVMLEFALLQFGLELLRSKGFEVFITPDLAKSKYYLGTGYMPKGDEAQIYEIEGDDLGLIATAEITMAGYHADELFTGNDLPKKYAAISHCYRREAGAYGKYSKGLYRVHQFTKLEMFGYVTPESSAAMHAEILGIEEEIANALGIPYRVLQMCTADLGAMAAAKYDLEAWMPGRGEYGEITSTSNTLDYQARNLNIRYKTNAGENKYVHMLNGTAMAISRYTIAIMENYQQEDGSIRVPEVLKKWMGKDVMGR